MRPAFSNRIKSCLAVAAIIASSPVASWSSDDCDCDFGGGGCDSGQCAGIGQSIDRWHLFTQNDSLINVHGWVNAGFIGNTSSPASGFNGPYNAVDRANSLMMNQLYVVAERELPTSGSGIGGRVDLIYGEDFLLAQSTGMERQPDGSQRWNKQDYGLALPQAYLTIGNRDLNLQAGHFYSIIGYEGVPAPSNFFYSKSYSYQFAGPFVHWGALLNGNLTDEISAQAGLVNGWDALDRDDDSLAFMGKIRYENRNTGVWTSFALITGQEANNPGGLAIVDDQTNRTRYSWLVGLPLTERMDYVFHHWLGSQAEGDLQGGSANWYGIDQYVYYNLNECWKTGVRFEWFHDEDGTRVGLNRANNPNNPSFPGDVYSLSAGVNWTPTGNLTLRPEIRADWYDGEAVRSPFDDGAATNQLMLGLDAILLF